MPSSSKEFVREVIRVEVDKGFLYVPSKAVDLMPVQKGKISVVVAGADKSLDATYNPDTRRIYGLTAAFRSIGAQAKTRIRLSYLSTNRYELASYREHGDEESHPPASPLDLSALNSREKGDIVEDRIKDLIVLHGQGLLSVYRPVTDTKGVDMLVVKDGAFHPLFIQVKSRFVLHQKKNFLMDIGANFTPHPSFYVVGAYFDPTLIELSRYLLFVPTQHLVKKGTQVQARGKKRYRVTTPLTLETKSKWRPYIIEKTELASKLLELFSQIDRFIK